MPTYTYTARDRAGNIRRGTLEAESDVRAVASLQEQGLWITDLRPARAPARAVPLGPVRVEAAGPLSRARVSLKDLALFYRQLHTLLHSGMPIYQSLTTLAQPTQSPNPQLRAVVAEIANQLLAGNRLSTSMARYPRIFDRMQVRMVEAGEAGGLLVTVLGRLADYLEREYQLRLEIKRKTLYPKILLFAVLFIPPVPTLVLKGPVAYLAEIWGLVWMALLFGVPLLLAIRALVGTQAGRHACDHLKLAVPVIGPLVRKLAAARFARTLAALYGAGVPIASAIAMAGESSGNSVLENAASGMSAMLERGARISQAIASSGFFPPMFVGMVGTGETTGNLDETLNKAADFYEQEAMHATIQLVVILGVVLLLAMALVIALKVISFWTSFYGGVGAGGLPGPGGDAGGLAGE